MKTDFNTNLSKQNIQDIIGLSQVQEGLLFHYLADKNSGQYYEQLKVYLYGNISTEIFQKTWKHLVKENEVLRSIFRWENLKKPIQIVLKESDVNIYYFDLDHIVTNSAYEKLKHIISEEEKTELLKNTHSEQKKQIIDKIINYDSTLSFDFVATPFRIYLLCDGNQSIMIISHHHILFDGWSTSILLKDFILYYKLISDKKNLTINKKSSFKEYLSYLQNIDKDQHKLFWKNYLAGYVFELTDTLLSNETSKYGYFVYNIKSPLYEHMVKYAQSQKISLSVFIYVIWGIVELYYKNKSDHLIGVTTSGRSENINSIENIVGLFVQTNPLRIKIDEASSFSDYIAQYQKLFTEWMSYTAYSLPQIKKDLQLQGKQELFDTLIVIENYPIDKILLQEDRNTLLSVSKYEIQEKSNHKLLVTIQTGKELKFALSYDLGKYSNDVVQSFMNDFQSIAELVVSVPTTSLSDIFNYLSVKHKNYYEQMCTQITYPKDELIHEQFEKQVLQTPNQIALETAETNISYEELNKQSNKLAHSLRQTGIENNTVVGIKIKPSSELVIAILAVLKAGGVFCPIDPKLPVERIKYMLQDSGASILISDQDESLAQEPSIQFINIKDESIYAHYPSQNIQIRKKVDDIIYIIYTSGSTGLPKGVQATYNNVNSIMHSIESIVKYKQEDKVLCLTTISFDPFIMESLLPLIKGMTVAIANNDAQLDPKILCEFIVEKSVTLMQATPSRIKLLLESEGCEKALSQIRLLMLGGEVLSTELYSQLRQKTKAQIFNLYGTTESTLFTTIQEVKDVDDITIGTPIPNSYIYVMDRKKRVLPPNIQGELYIGGDGVANGYKNKDELTKKCFIQDPYKPNNIIYKTGDLGELRSDDQYLYMGRIDNQVKIRGYRIELEEIESILKQSPHINNVAVVVREITPGNDQLVACVCPDNKDLSIQLRDLADAKLPEYMRPAHYVFMPSLSINTNGKIDKASLASIIFKQEKTDKAVKVDVSEIEKNIHDIWKEVLGIETVPYNENFFDLGGHSLLAIQVVNKIKQKLNKEITVLDVFKYTTIRSLSIYLSENSDVKPIDTAQPIDSQEKKSNTNDVAVIGIACRFPKAENKNEFWDNLIQGKECISFFSDKELLEEGIPIETIKSPNYVKAKGVLENIEYFDSSFFSYSPRESELMDPQIRVLHECVWEALEDAGCYNGKHNNIGLYAGALTNVYWIKSLAQKQLSPAETWEAENLNLSITTPISYKLNLKGPSVQVESACSTSLVAVHKAYNAIIHDECDIALAGGVSMTLPQKSGYEYQDGMIRSKDGHCRPFDILADGTLTGDGVGIVVLKKLDEAIKDNDQIYAVIKGSAINNDGKYKVGYSAPSSEGQSEVIAKAYRNSNINVETISYIEAHGTATSIGDPIEIEGLKTVFGNNQSNTCSIGSVKSNIGHLNAASGIAGFIKTVLSLKHKTLPKTLHYNQPNPKLDIENSPFYIQAQTSQWQSNDNQPLRAGVSSFGIGGTNAHVVLEEYITKNDNAKNAARSSYLILLSAKTEKALEQKIIQLRDYLIKNPSCNLIDLCYTLQVGREHFEYKFVALCSSKDDAIAKLSLCNKQLPETYFSFTQSDTKKLELPLNENKKNDSKSLLCYLTTISPLIAAEYDTIYTSLGRCNQIELEKLQNLLLSIDKKSNNWVEDITSLEQVSLNILALLWLDGINVKWSRLYNGIVVSKISLPLYPFSKDYYWKFGYNNKNTRQEVDSTDNWIYLPVWKESELALSTKEQGMQKWMFINNNTPHIIDAATQQYSKSNVITISYSDVFQRINGQQIGMDFHNSDNYKLLIDYLQGLSIDQVNIVYYPQSQHANEMHQDFYKSIEAFLYFIQHIGKSKSLKNVKVLIINEGKDIDALSHYLIKGSLVVANHEYSNLKIHWIESDTHINFDQISQEFNVGFVENKNLYHICYKEEKRYLNKYKNLFPIDVKLGSYPFKKGGTYLITGGLGGISLEIIKDLADNIGNANLILITRRTFPRPDEWENIIEKNIADTATIAQIKKLKYGLEKGLSIHIESVDITDQQLMKNLYVKYINKYGKLDGIIHSAGLSGGTLIDQENIENLKKITDAKINGANIIYELLKEHNCTKPDFCLFFSSINTEIGSPGQFSYVSANQYLNEISKRINSELGIKALSIAWDTWSEVGMAVDCYSARDNKVRSFELDHYLFSSKDLRSDNDNYLDEIIYNFSLNSSFHWFLNEHRFNTKALMPATGYIELIASAIREHYSTINFKIDEVVFIVALMLEEEETRKAKLVIHQNDNNKLRLVILSKPDKYSDKWIEHAKASIELITDKAKELASTKVPKGSFDHYIDYTKQNYNYNVGNLIFGERWKLIQNISYSTNTYQANLSLNEKYRNDLESTILHPAMLDIATSYAQSFMQNKKNHYIPFCYKNIKVYSKMTPSICSYLTYKGETDGSETLSFEVVITDPYGKTILECEQFIVKKLNERNNETPQEIHIPDVPNYKLIIQNPGDINTLQIESCNRKKLDDNEVEIEVMSTGLNFKEILIALGILPMPEKLLSTFGLECSGRVSRIGKNISHLEVGDEVIAMTYGTFSQFAYAKAHTVVKKPKTLSFEEAAAIPLAFITAYYALVIKGNLQKNDKILIHAASGGVGMAAIKIAQWIGAEIYATAGSESKRDYLRSIGVKHVMNSRSLDFADEIKLHTNSYGVDLILNSLSGDSIDKSLSILAPNGSFLEIGLRDIIEGKNLSMKLFNDGRSFINIMIKDDLPNFYKIFSEISHLFDTKQLSPIPIKTYHATGVKEAFSYMIAAKHIGKIVLNHTQKNANINQGDLFKQSISSKDGIYILNSVLTTLLYPSVSKLSQIIVSTEDLNDRVRNRANLSYEHLIKAKNDTENTRQKRDNLKLDIPYNSPKTIVEQKLAELIERHLGLDRVGINDNLEEIGMSSLDMIQITSTINNIFGINISVVDMYAYPTVEDLAAMIEKEIKSDNQAREEEEIPVLEEESIHSLKATISRFNKKQ